MVLDLSKLQDRDPLIKYGFSKELLQVAADNPALLYTYFDDWVALLNVPNNILKWTAIDILGRLSAVDSENRIDKVLGKLIVLLHGGHLITTNHAVFALGLIARNKPRYRDRIIREWLAVAKDVFDTEECRDIAMGKVIEEFNGFQEEIRGNAEALEFIREAQDCQRNATRKKADKLLQKLDNAAV